MISSASSGDLVAMTTMMTPHPHLNQIYNLRPQHNRTSGAISTPRSGGAGWRDRGAQESAQLSTQTYFFSPQTLQPRLKLWGGGQWQAAWRHEVFVSPPVSPQAPGGEGGGGEASMAATSAGAPLLFFAVLAVRRMADGGLLTPLHHHHSSLVF